MKIGIIVQARNGSTRLPGKVLMNLMGKPVLVHVIDRLKQVKMIDEIIIATTDLPKDDSIEVLALQEECIVFRGDENHVLSRYYFAAKQRKIDIVIRVTSDCPLIDPKVIESMIDYFLNQNKDFVTNAGSLLENRTYPRGFDTEIFYFKYLEEAYKNADKIYQMEHVTPWLYEHCNNIYYFKNNIDYSKYRLTLDTMEDYELIQIIYRDLYQGSHNFYMKEIIRLLLKNPHYCDINSDIEQKKLVEK